jgi:two-component system, cell cycle sensor histidine kinase and response regulator CckA
MNQLHALVLSPTDLVGVELAGALQGLGVEASYVRSWEEAVAAATNRAPQLLLVELGLVTSENARQGLLGLLQGGEAALVCFSQRGQRFSGALAEGSAVPVAPADTHLLLPSPQSDLRAALAYALTKHPSIDFHWPKDLAVVATDLLGRVQFLNAAAAQVTGWSLPEAMQRPVKEVLDLADAPPQAEPLVLTARNATRHFVRSTKAPLRDYQGGLTGMVMLVEVLPETKGAALPPPPSPAGGGLSLTKAIRHHWPDLSVMVQSIADPLFSVEPDWTLSYLNDAAAELMETQPHENLVGKSLWSLLPKSIYHDYYHEFSQAMARKLPRTFEFSLAAAGRWFEAQLYPYGDGLLGLWREVTGRKMAEEQERKMEKLESLGLLARGFAHDFNNLLTVMLGNISLAEDRLTPAADGYAEVVTARKTAQQAQGLVQHLLTFARGGAPLKQPTDLGLAIRQWSHDWLGQAGLDYEYELAANCLAEVDRQQFLRLVHNLLRNAEQALGKCGQVRVILAEGEKVANLPAALPIQQRDLKDWLILQVCDNGHGISEEHLSKVFEPYFTTREDANASGLGLTVCESIIKAHGAIFTLQSRLGEGTVATVAIPRHRPVKPLLQIEEAAATQTHPLGPRRVLLLEDELLIRRLSVQNLKKLDCEVVETAEGTETLRVYETALREGRPFDLVIMDLSIPGGMGGLQTMELLREIDPAVVAIVSSGYSDDPVMQRYLDFGFQARLPKPYRPEELRELVQQLGRRLLG